MITETKGPSILQASGVSTLVNIAEKPKKIKGKTSLDSDCLKAVANLAEVCR